MESHDESHLKRSVGPCLSKPAKRCKDQRVPGGKFKNKTKIG
jgi:hypothetical protein